MCQKEYCESFCSCCSANSNNLSASGGDLRNNFDDPAEFGAGPRRSIPPADDLERSGRRDHSQDPPDVAAERERAMTDTSGGGVVIRDLRKKYRV